MMSDDPIYYNSWSENYRRPVGSIPIGRSVFFAIHVPIENVQRVELAVQKDGADSQYLEMHPGNDDQQIYKTQFVTSGSSGLFFYHFRISYHEGNQAKMLYYGKAADDFGGEGMIYESAASIRQYQLTAYDHPDPAPDWYRNGIIYHIFVDRFNNGNPHHLIEHPKPNSFIYATEADDPYYIRDAKGNIVRWDFYGGNLKGIIDKLHDLQRFGVSILYLSPIFEASSNHKYNTADYTKIDPMFGDQRLFEKLIKKAKKLNMHIILDGVFNHVGVDSIYFNRFGNYGEGGAYQDPSSPYYSWFNFHSYPASYDSWWSIDDLPTVNKDLPEFRKFIYDSAGSIIDRWTKLGIGGWRLDVADELPDDFIAGIRRAVDEHAAEKDEKVLIGEVWEDASHKIAYGKRRHYLEGGMLHSVMNYPLRSLIIDFVEQRLSARSAARLLLTLKSNYPPDAFQATMNNIGTHDTERIFTVLGKDRKKLRLAVWLLMTLPGVPCIYYGDEAGLTGGKDPENRRFYPWGREDLSIKEIYQQAIQARRSDQNLVSGDFLPFSIGKLLAFFRYQSDGLSTLVLLNPTDHEAVVKWGEITDETGGGRILSWVKEHLNEGQTMAPFSFQLTKSHGSL
ncbi:MAG: glycoside hydrolase family 13 protein [Sporolactobacillus sp.]